MEYIVQLYHSCYGEYRSIDCTVVLAHFLFERLSHQKQNLHQFLFDVSVTGRLISFDHQVKYPPPLPAVVGGSADIPQFNEYFLRSFPMRRVGLSLQLNTDIKEAQLCRHVMMAIRFDLIPHQT